MKRLLSLFSVVCLLSSVAAAASKGPEPLRIAQGETVRLADHLVPGKTVIFDFTSKYCPPCRAYDEPLHQLHTSRDDIVVVQVDINRPGVQRIDWQSPVARQFGLQSIPQFKIYGPDGKLVAEDKLVFSADGKPVQRDTPARRMVDEWIGRSH
ncbi:MAG: TlpA family protein disulfide reductase [Verrucomicrobiota bacterium]